MSRSSIAGCALGVLLAACGARTGTSDLLAAGSGGTAASGGTSGSGGSSIGGAGPAGSGGTVVDAGTAGSGGTATGGGTGGMPAWPPVMSVAAGSRHTCVLVLGGSVRCWGWGERGSIGHAAPNDVGDDETPASLGLDVSFGGSAEKLAIGEGQTCVLLTTGAVRCWGYGGDGRLGYGNTANIGDDETPSAAGDVDVGGEVVSIAAGGTQTCAVLRGGAVRCWGAGSSGQLGYGNLEDIGDDETPSAAGDVDVGGPVSAIAAGSLHTCALLESGAVRCWGYAGSGRLGYGNGNGAHVGDDEAPSAAGDVDVGERAVQIDGGNDHTCALLSNGRVRCWGPGSYGRLGYGDTDRIGDDEPPRAAGNVDVGGPVRQIAVGAHHTCALVDDGSVRCWGLASYGRLGYGNTENVGDDETPSSVGEVPIF